MFTKQVQTLRRFESYRHWYNLDRTGSSQNKYRQWCNLDQTVHKASTDTHTGRETVWDRHTDTHFKSVRGKWIVQTVQTRTAHAGRETVGNRETHVRTHFKKYKNWRKIICMCQWTSELWHQTRVHAKRRATILTIFTRFFTRSQQQSTPVAWAVHWWSCGAARARPRYWLITWYEFLRLLSNTFFI